MTKGKKSLLIGSSLLLSTIIPTTILTTSCSASGTYAFGNFESYISPEVVDEFNSSYGDINWQYYTSNKQINTQLQNKTLNSAVPTNDEIAKLGAKGLINPIQWEKFELLKPNTNQPTNPSFRTNEQQNQNNIQTITSVNDLQGLYSDLVWNIATQAFTDIIDANLLTYCIPYFIQNVVFVYRGDAIPELENKKDNITFTDIFEQIATNPVFKAKKSGYNVMMVDDHRLLFDISKIIKGEKTNQANIDINPTSSAIYNSKVNDSNAPAPTIEYFQEIFSYVKKYIDNKNAPIGLQSNSNILINKLATNQIKGAFVYNGDAVFAALGGDYAGINAEADNITVDNFHVLIPKNNLVAMDGIVFNKKNSQEEELKGLNFAFNLTLSGLPTKTYNNYNTPISYQMYDSKNDPSINPNFDPNTQLEEKPDKNILVDNKPVVDSQYQYIGTTKQIINQSTGKPELDENNQPVEKYVFSSMQNFDYVNYAPTLKAILDIINNHEYFDSNDSNGDGVFDSKDDDWALSSMLIKLLNIPVPNNNPKTFVELPLTDLAESNMNIAYLDLKA